MRRSQKEWNFGSLSISRTALGPFETNCYILTDLRSHDAVVIDPAAEGEFIAGQLLNQGVRLNSIILTHGHFDHMGGIEGLRAGFPVEVFIHSLDAGRVAHSSENFSLFTGSPVEYHGTTGSLTDGMIIAFGNVEIRVVHTPGHTPGSICLSGDGFILTGDTLFRNSIGRTDLPGSSGQEILDSIRNRLLKLEDDTLVLPGHGDETTIGHERRRNPFIA